MPRISICIPFYSGLGYLKEAVESVRMQTLREWEAFIVDDCGPEKGVLDWVESLADPRIQYLRNDRNLGLAGNWNHCLSLARSDLVTLLHADDKLEPTYAEKMTETAQCSPDITAFFCRAKIINHEGKPVFSFPDFIKSFIMPSRSRPITLQGEDSLNQLLKGVFIFCPTLCFRKSRLRGREFSSHWRMVLDLDLVARLLIEGDLLYGLPEKLYHYRRHSMNQTTLLTSSFKRFEEEVAIYNSLGKQCEERSWTKAHRTAINMSIVKLNLAYCFTKSLAKAQFSQALQALKFMKRFWLLPSD